MINKLHKKFIFSDKRKTQLKKLFQPVSPPRKKKIKGGQGKIFFFFFYKTDELAQVLVRSFQQYCKNHVFLLGFVLHLFVIIIIYHASIIQKETITQAALTVSVHRQKQTITQAALTASVHRQKQTMTQATAKSGRALTGTVA